MRNRDGSRLMMMVVVATTCAVSIPTAYAQEMPPPRPKPPAPVKPAEPPTPPNATIPRPRAQGLENTQDGSPLVVISTSLGDITVQLEPDKAPKSVANFLAYVNEGFYDGTIFHRVINDFMIQGGGLTADLKLKPTKPPIKNEADNGLRNDTGTIAMARTSAVDSATAQFFINTKDNDFLNHGSRDFGYAVFGKVIAGMDVVRKIEAVPTGRGDVPNKTVTIRSIRRER